MRLPDRARSRVVLIGNSLYRDERHLPELPEVRKSIADLRAALTDREYGIVPPQHCITLVDEPNLHTLGEALLAASEAAEDFFLVYFIGHGLIGRNNDLYLGLYNSRWESPSFGSLRYDTLRDTVLDCPAVTRTIILDCCFSGRALGGTMASSAAVADQMEVDGTYVLTSAPPNKLSLILPDEEHTAFTGRLLRLLNDGIPQAAPTLSMDELYRRLRRTMRSAGLPEPQRRSTGTAELLALARNRAHGPGRAAAARETDPPNLPDERQEPDPDPLERRKGTADPTRQNYRVRDVPSTDTASRSGREAEKRAGRQADAQVASRASRNEPARLRVRPKASKRAPATEPEYRDRVKQLVRTHGFESAFACSVCGVAVKGRNLVRHLDERHPEFAGPDLPAIVTRANAVSTSATTTAKAGPLSGSAATTVGQGPFPAPFLPLVERRPRLSPTSGATAAAPVSRDPVTIPPTSARDREAVKRLVLGQPGGATFACPRCAVSVSGPNLVRHIDRQHGW